MKRLLIGCVHAAHFWDSVQEVSRGISVSECQRVSASGSCFGECTRVAAADGIRRQRQIDADFGFHAVASRKWVFGDFLTHGLAGRHRARAGTARPVSSRDFEGCLRRQSARLARDRVQRPSVTFAPCS